MSTVEQQIDTALDSELASDVMQEYENVTLYTSGPYFGEDQVCGNKASPLAVITNGSITLARSPDNAGLIKALIRQYGLTTSKAKAKANAVPKHLVLRGGKKAFPNATAAIPETSN